MTERVSVRPAAIDDAELLFRWRNDPLTVASSRSGKEVEWDGHVRWLSEQLQRDDRAFLIGLIGSMPPCGLVWFALNRGRVWETSVTLDSAYRGQGIGAIMLRAALSWMKENKSADAFSTDIQENNAAAIKMYERCGFRYIHPSPGYGTYFASF